MKPFIYPAIAILTNFILFKGFPMAGGGASLGTLLTIPLIAIVSLLLTGIHYLIQRKKVKTKYFQMGGIAAILLVSYALFITDEGNTPMDIIGRMFKTGSNYKKIEFSDYFLEHSPPHFEKILAAKKKFKTQLPDTAYTISVTNPISYTTSESIGIYYRNGIPLSIDEHVKIQQLNNNAIRLTRIDKQDSLTFILTPLETEINSSVVSFFPEEHVKGDDEKNLRLADISLINKNNTLDRQYFAYGIFYWLL